MLLYRTLKALVFSDNYSGRACCLTEECYLKVIVVVR
jgi:hypothetical protein